MTLWDAHMHTSFSGDAHTPPEEMADTARGKQLPGITFTDHLDWDYRETPGMFDLDIEAYLQRITQLQAEYNTENFHIYLGLEPKTTGYLPLRFCNRVFPRGPRERSLLSLLL